MAITNQQRKEEILKSSDAIYDLYGSSELGSKIIAWSKESGFTPEVKSLFIDCIGDTILGFYQTKDLPALVQQEVGVTPEVAARIVADLAELMAPVLEREAMLANPKLGAIKELHQQFAKAGGTPGSEPAVAPTPHIAPAPVAPTAPVASEPGPLHNVAPMRTMAADMNRIHGYGAYRQVTQQADDGVVRAAPQDELLKERPRLTNTPRLGE